MLPSSSVPRSGGGASLVVEVQEDSGLLEVGVEEPKVKRARRRTKMEVLWEELPGVWGRSTTTCSGVGSRSRSKSYRHL